MNDKNLRCFNILDYYIMDIMVNLCSPMGHFKQMWFMMFIRCGTLGPMLSGPCRPWWDTVGRSGAFTWRANDWSAAQLINPSRSVRALIVGSERNCPTRPLPLFNSISTQLLSPTLPYPNSEPHWQYHLQCLSHPSSASLTMLTASS